MAIAALLLVLVLIAVRYRTDRMPSTRERMQNLAAVALIVGGTFAWYASASVSIRFLVLAVTVLLAGAAIWPRNSEPRGDGAK